MFRVPPPGLTLPGWIYRDAEFLELEKQIIFRTDWQLVCHENDIPGKVDYQVFDFLNESTLTIHGSDGREMQVSPEMCRVHDE